MPYTPDSAVYPSPGAAPAPRLMDEVRRVLRLKHYSHATEKANLGWIRRFILFLGKRHPREMGGAEVEEFLSALAVQGQVAVSTQNQALAALLFLYRQVLLVQLPWLDGVVRARKPRRLPVVLSVAEVQTLPACMDGRVGLVAPAVRHRHAFDGGFALAGQGSGSRAQ